jgi:hypothetical protein
MPRASRTKRVDGRRARASSTSADRVPKKRSEAEPSSRQAAHGHTGLKPKSDGSSAAPHPKGLRGDELVFEVGAGVIDRVIDGICGEQIVLAKDRGNGKKLSEAVLGNRIRAKITRSAVLNSISENVMVAFMQFALQHGGAGQKPLNSNFSFTRGFDRILLDRLPHEPRVAEALLQGLESSVKEFLRRGGKFEGEWGSISAPTGKPQFKVEPAAREELLPDLGKWVPAKKVQKY